MSRNEKNSEKLESSLHAIIEARHCPHVLSGHQYISFQTTNNQERQKWRPPKNQAKALAVSSEEEGGGLKSMQFSSAGEAPGYQDTTPVPRTSR
jgi:hypothetical protein